MITSLRCKLTIDVFGLFMIGHENDARARPCTKTVVIHVIHANNVVTISNIWSWVKFDGSVDGPKVHHSVYSHSKKQQEHRWKKKDVKFRAPRFVRSVIATDSIIIYYNHIFDEETANNVAFSVCVAAAASVAVVAASAAATAVMPFECMIFSLSRLDLVFALCHRPKINFSDANFRKFICKSGRNWNKYHVSLTLCMRVRAVLSTDLFAPRTYSFSRKSGETRWDETAA